MNKTLYKILSVITKFLVFISILFLAVISPIHGNSPLISMDQLQHILHLDSNQTAYLVIFIFFSAICSVVLSFVLYYFFPQEVAQLRKNDQEATSAQILSQEKISEVMKDIYLLPQEKIIFEIQPCYLECSGYKHNYRGYINNVLVTNLRIILISKNKSIWDHYITSYYSSTPEKIIKDQKQVPGSFNALISYEEDPSLGPSFKLTSKTLFDRTDAYFHPKSKEIVKMFSK